MDDRNLDLVFGFLNRSQPRAPAETVERMVQTVRKLEAERGRRFGEEAGKTESKAKAAEPLKNASVKKPPEKNPPVRKPPVL